MLDVRIQIGENPEPYPVEPYPVRNCHLFHLFGRKKGTHRELASYRHPLHCLLL